MPKFKPTLEQVTIEFGKAHAEEADAKTRMEKYRKQFFDLLKSAIPSSELARQTIYYEGEDPDAHIATLYPKWKVLKKELLDEFPAEWRILIEEDPERKSWIFVNPINGYVFQRTVAESAPGIDLERMKEEDPFLYQTITVEPPKPERVLRPLSELKDMEKDLLKEYLLPPKLTNRMEKPRPAKAEELEGLQCQHPNADQDPNNESTWHCLDCGETFLP